MDIENLIDSPADVAGGISGMGRHLGVFSCTMLCNVRFILPDCSP